MASSTFGAVREYIHTGNCSATGSGFSFPTGKSPTTSQSKRETAVRISSPKRSRVDYLRFHCVRMRSAPFHSVNENGSNAPLLDPTRSRTFNRILTKGFWCL